MDPERYDLEAVGITREGQWVRADDAVAALHHGAGALPAAAPGHDHLEAAGTAVEPLPTVRPAATDELPVVILPLLHGTRGEDGTVQGMLELADVPYVGAGVLGSALCMDKLKAKDVLAAHGLPQVPWLGRRDTELAGVADAARAAGLRYPMFVKPANLGSSVGVSRATDDASLEAACATASDYDEWIVIEQGVTAREIEVAVLGNAEPRASVPGEVRPTHEFYDYEDKYLDGAADLIIPADLPDDVAERIRDLAVEAFTVLRCDGMARVDFFYEPDTGTVLHQRAEHDPRLHADLDVPEAVGGQRTALPGAHRRARAPRRRTPRAPPPLLDQGAEPTGEATPVRSAALGAGSGPARPLSAHLLSAPDLSRLSAAGRPRPG